MNKKREIDMTSKLIATLALAAASGMALAHVGDHADSGVLHMLIEHQHLVGLGLLAVGVLTLRRIFNR